MKRAGRLFAFLLFVASLMALLALPAVAQGRVVVVATLDGEINPITDNYIVQAIGKAGDVDATALVIAMDTPGGLDTSMRDIIKHMLAAPFPVVVYVSPSGARGASAGFFITEAADIAAMAPGTNVGSAHPVSLSGSNPVPNPSASPQTSTDIEDIKVENDAAAYIRALATLHHHNVSWAEQAVRQSSNATAEEAVKLNVVDLESRDLSTLLTDLNGRTVAKGGHTYVLDTANAAIDNISLSDFDRLLLAIADPNVAYLLLLLAIVGIGVWVTHPGLFLPGVVGVIAAIFAALALFNLPVNLAGLILILIAIVLFVVDIKAVTHGVLTTGGIVAMLVGGLLLIDTGYLSIGVNVFLLVVTVFLIAGAFAFVLRKVVVARSRPFAAGEESLVGREGQVREALNPSGMIFVDGALWQATSRSGAIAASTPVRVVAVEGLRLIVEPVSRQPSSSPDRPPQAAAN